MSSDTVTIDGIEFNIDALEAALDAAEDSEGETQRRTAIAGGIIVAGDFDPDDFVRVAHVENVVEASPGSIDTENDEQYIFDTTRSIRSYIEEARVVPFTEYLEEQEWMHDQTEVEETNSAYGDATLSYDSDGDLYMNRDEMEALDAADDIGLSRIVSGKLYVTDERDE